MANTTVGIRERIKNSDGRWRWSPSIPIPELPLESAIANRQGSFYLVWTENRNKREKAVKGDTFEMAVKAARVKERYLQDAADGFQRPDPLVRTERKTIAASIDQQLEKIEVSRDPKTLKAHRQALRQFERWTKKTFIDEIDHDHLMAFRNLLLKDGNEKKNCRKRGNDRLTANWKAMRVNKLVKETLGLLPGKGPIKKSDLGKMKPDIPPKIYSKSQLGDFFQACKPHERLRYRTLYEPAFRKEELMYLEIEDVLVDKQMLRVKSKTRYDENGDLLYEYEAKAASEREIPVSQELMQQLVEQMKKPRPENSRLVFCTQRGRPDTHMWDKLQVIAKRSGLGKFDLKTFRATRATDWLRPKWLGGFGYDIPTVKNLLGHDRDGESIWAYVRAVENEVLVAKMNESDLNGRPQVTAFEKSKVCIARSERPQVSVVGIPVSEVLPLTDSEINRR
jgi:integrase